MLRTLRRESERHPPPRSFVIAKSRKPVVIALSDGTRHKGMIDEFHPSRATLRLQEVDHGGSMIEVHDIDMYDVHAVFFVRSLAIYRTFRLTDRFAPSQPAPDAGGTRIRVHFIWGEALDGVVYGPLAGRTGFFLYPLGALGRAYNIERVYVTRKSVTKLERLDAERSPNAAEG